VFCKQADDETWRAVAALRAAPRCHRGLCFAQNSIGRKRFDRVDLPSRGHRQKHETTVDDVVAAFIGARRWGCRRPRLNERYGARTAFTFSAPLFRTRQPAAANEIQQRHLRGRGINDENFTVQGKRDAGHA
jgi:hypothetical protein